MLVAADFIIIVLSKSNVIFPFYKGRASKSFSQNSKSKNLRPLWLLLKRVKIVNVIERIKRGGEKNG